MAIEHIQDILKNININTELKIGLQTVFHNDTMSFNIGVVPSTVPDHYHKISDELYYIHKGQGRMRINDTYTVVNAGDVVTIPRSSVHGLVNSGQDDMIIFIITSPPFDPKNDRFLA
jgi:mannose-6-phosphate isomerase-like protein (cupin superfamily)